MSFWIYFIAIAGAISILAIAGCTFLIRNVEHEK